MKREARIHGGPALLIAALAAAVFAAWALGPGAALTHAAEPAAAEPGTGADEPWPHPSEMQFERITFDPVEPVRFELSNGIVVYFLEDRDLPTVSGRIYLPVSPLTVAPSEAGLSTFTSWLAAMGGGSELSLEEMDRELDFMASQSEIITGPTYTGVRFWSLAEFAGRTIEIATDMLTRPRFSPEHVEYTREQLIGAVRRQYEETWDGAERFFMHLLAPDHPMGRSLTESEIRSLSHEDAVEFHRRYFGPEGAVVAVAGDIDLATLRSELERTIGTWRPAEAKPAAPPEFNPAREPKIYHVQRQIQQSYVVIGHAGIPLGDPDRAAIELANLVLGASSADSRLVRAIRTKGLARDAISRLTSHYLVPGFFYVIAVAPAANTGHVIELIKTELRRLVDEPITPVELEQSRNAVFHRALYEIEKPLDVVTRKALAELHGLDPDYYEQYLDRLQTITVEEVHAAVRRWLDPDRMITLVIGDAAAFDRPLSDFGEVEEVDFEI